MWHAVALTLVMTSSVVSAGELELVGNGFSYGFLGAKRADSRFLPGDVVVFNFMIQGLQYDSDGKASYSVALTLVDDKGKVHLEQKPQKLQAFNYLGGDGLPGVAHVQLAPEHPAGKFTMKVTVTDQSNQSSKTLEQGFEVLPPDFGLVQVNVSADREGLVPIPPVGVVGQTLFVNFSAVGFGRQGSSKQPDIAVTLRLLDSNGKSTTPKPLTGEARRSIPENLKLLGMQFGVSLNRTGSFSVEIKATDRISNKTSTVTFPLRVLEP